MDSIGEDVSFMSLGIDSVGAVEIAAEIEQATGLSLSPETIYEYRTLRELTAYLGSLRGFGPTGQDSPAQGNALGSASSRTASPEGQRCEAFSSS